MDPAASATAPATPAVVSRASPSYVPPPSSGVGPATFGNGVVPVPLLLQRPKGDAGEGRAVSALRLPGTGSATLMGSGVRPVGRGVRNQVLLPDRRGGAELVANADSAFIS